MTWVLGDGSGNPGSSSSRKKEEEKNMKGGRKGGDENSDARLLPLTLRASGKK